jgi:hypothetical protein
MAGSGEHDGEPFGSMKGGEFLYQLWDFISVFVNWCAPTSLDLP